MPIGHTNYNWRVPVIGPWLGRAGSVAQIEMMACSPSPLAWVEAGVVGTLHMLVSLLKPVPWAPSISRARGGFSHGGGGTSREPNEEDEGGGGGGRGPRGGGRSFKVVYNLPGNVPLEEGPFSTVLFDVGELALQIGWYIFLADLGTELAVNWTSLAYQYGGCDASGVGPCDTVAGPGTILAISPSAQDSVWDVITDPDNWCTVRGIYVPAYVDASIGISIVVSPYYLAGPPAGQVAMFIKDNTNNLEVSGTYAQGPSGAVDPYRLTRIAHIPALSGGVEYVPTFYNAGFYSDLAGSRFWAGASTDFQSPLKPDP